MKSCYIDTNNDVNEDVLASGTSGEENDTGNSSTNVNVNQGFTDADTNENGTAPTTNEMNGGNNKTIITRQEWWQDIDEMIR